MSNVRLSRVTQKLPSLAFRFSPRGNSSGLWKNALWAKKKKSSVLIEVKEACVGVGKRVAMETHAGKVEKGGLHMRETGSGGFCLEATHDDIITGLTSIDQWYL